MSLRWPGEPIRRTGFPSASPAAWILVLKPPRERPRPWAFAPLFAGQRRQPADAPARWWNRSSAIPDRLRAKARRGWRPDAGADRPTLLCRTGAAPRLPEECQFLGL